MSVRVPVTFRNRAGLQLFGILHTPEGGSPGDVIVLLLSPGVKMRVGPQRLYLQLAETLVAMGLTVLRFDFHGLGDSEGVLPEELLKDVYNHIEVGRYVDDTIDAMDWVQRTYGCRRFLVSGLCGGAITGLLAGERDGRVVGLLGLGITPVLASRAADASRYMTVGQLEQQQKMYLRRLLSPQAWFRLFTFQTDNYLIRRMVRHWVRKFLRRPAQPTVAAATEHDNANPLFPPAYFSMLSRRRPMLLVFGGSDRLHWEYQEKFVSRHRERIAAMPSLTEVHVVELANHVLSLQEWQDEMLSVSTAWMKKHFGSDLIAETYVEAVAAAGAYRSPKP